MQVTMAKCDRLLTCEEKFQFCQTFGMKNKKGGKAQQQIKTIQQQQETAGKSREQLAKDKKKEDEKRMKAEAEKARREDPAFAIAQPRVPFGVDPKTITCAFWKAGICDKGGKCKFAHKEDAARKVEKKDLYTDMREGDASGGANGAANGGGEGGDANKKDDTMDKWDRAKLDSVILSKHGNPKSTTDKVCKFFLQAVEDGKYGWFWECPNGGEKCMYKHRLPPGFVLQSQKREREEADKANEISLEEFLETARHQLGSNLTPVTAETFATWKKQRVDKKQAEEEAIENKKKQQAQANKMAGLSGREIFTLNPTWLDEEDGDGAGDEFDMEKYFTNWEQARSDDGKDGAGGDDDEAEVNEANAKLANVSV